MVNTRQIVSGKVERDSVFGEGVVLVPGFVDPGFGSLGRCLLLNDLVSQHFAGAQSLDGYLVLQNVSCSS